MTDTYEEKITDPSCRRMRAASGRVDDFRPLVAFLYELARDHVPTGRLEGFLDRVVAISAPDEDGERGPCQFTNGWLARWAQDAAERLTEPPDSVLPDDVLAAVLPRWAPNGDAAAISFEVRKWLDEFKAAGFRVVRA